MTTPAPPHSHHGYSPVSTVDPDAAGHEDHRHHADHSHTDESYHDHLAASLALLLSNQTTGGSYNVDTDSVYGACIALPQLARTSGWSLHYTAYAIRGYIFLITNFMLQGFCIFMITKEERVNNKFGGQMHLCNFAAEIEQCPGARDCVGPGGTAYSPARLYNWNMWALRTFLRQSFESMFPELLLEVDQNVDPGEYGLESWWLRVICCFIFVMGLWPDLSGSQQIGDLLYHIPTSNDPWMKFHEGAVSQDDPMSRIEFRVAGMPLLWKIINVITVLLPKLYIWILTIEAGTLFLMETAGIEDMVTNTVSLSFILNLDELIHDSMVFDASRDMLERMQPFMLSSVKTPSEVDLARQHEKDHSWTFWSPSLYQGMMPRRAFLIIGTLLFFYGKYYIEHCHLGPDGSLVAHDVFSPVEANMELMSFLLGPVPGARPVETSSELLWTMP